MSYEEERDFFRYGGGWGAKATPERYRPSQSGTTGRRRNADQKLVEQLSDGLNRMDVDAGAIAASLSLLPTGIQQNLFDIVLLYLGALADRDGRYPGHQMETAYAQARTMMESVTRHR